MDDKRANWLEDFIAPFRVKPGSRVRLPGDYDTRWDARMKKKKEGVRLLAEGMQDLAEYQTRLAAQDTWGLLVVLQAMDAAGKDSLIAHVMSGVNPQGVQVRSFKVPSAEELSHDYLWRYTRQLPARGEIGIFNRSHYEEVLVVRVHPENLDRQHLPHDTRHGDVWQRRYQGINDWERHLSENGFRVVKLFLNLSKEEQRRRFLRRLDLPDHTWKFSPADVAERARWDDYQAAYSEMLSHTSTEWAPWYVIPADRKWFERLAGAAVILQALVELDPQFPVVDEEQRAALRQVKSALEAEAPEGSAPDPFESQAPG